MRVRSIIILLFACLSACLSAKAQDTLRVLCIGNSFTYVDSTQAKLRSLAAAEGHTLIINTQTQGGYTFQKHLRRDQTLSAIIYYTYDVAFLQDQSFTPALYAQNPRNGRVILDDAQEIAARIRFYSPKVRLILEQTWAYESKDYAHFGSYEAFDSLLRKGTKQIAQGIKADVSPIGEAFRLCRERYPEIDLYQKDRQHQSAYGAYLKACVNYQMLYHTPFTAEENCGLEADKCAKLRQVAETLFTK